MASDGERVMRRYPNTTSLRIVKWLGTVFGVTGALIIAMNLGVVGYGFVLFLGSSLLWGTAGWLQRDGSLVVLQGTFTVINVIGIYRWIGA